MKKSILINLLFFSAIQLITAQKISLTYKVKCNDSIYVITDNAFSDKIIQTKSDDLFSKKIQNKKIISIEDNINRRFDKTNFNNINYYSKLLNEGYYNLYELELNSKPIYFIYSKHDTVVLESKDTLVKQTIVKDRKYNGKLVLLCKDYPELWVVAGNVDFKRKDIQNLISVLNEKHNGNIIRKQENNRIDFLSFSLKGMIQKNKTDIMLDVIISQYFLNISPNLSLKYGLMANYNQQTDFFPTLSELREVMVQGIWTRRIYYYYRDHYETMTRNAFEIPVFLNYEITNSKITPYFYLGLAPTFYIRKITRTDTDAIDNISKFTLNGFAGTGIKLKLTKSFNILAEYRYELLKGSNIELGIQYYIKL